VQQYSNITFLIFAVFNVQRSVAVNMCINLVFYINISKSKSILNY